MKKIYTKTGDRGQTGLFGGARVSKAQPRVAAYGEVDELNAALGVARAHSGDERSSTRLQRIQSELFNLGAELASDPHKDIALGIALVGEDQIGELEHMIDELEAELPELKTFVLPGGTAEAAFLHAARTMCRRAERTLVALADGELVRPELLRYLNRLSDLLFVMARHSNFRAKIADVPWLGRDRREA